MLDFVRDPNKVQILRIRVSCSAFDGGLLFSLNEVKPASYKDISILQTAKKISVWTD